MQHYIEALLKEKIGLDGTTMGSNTISIAIKQRMRLCHIEGIVAYYELLQGSKQEWQELIETVVIPETCFFRDREPFIFLKDHILPQNLLKPGKVWRLLSIPCASGEEPYSMVMTLLEAGLMPQQFQVEAMDISQRAIQKAKLGVYSKNSFRGVNPEIIQRYFVESDQGFTLNEAIKSQVQFSCANLLALKYFPPYDVIFCRNLLIYFDQSARAKALKNLQKLLCPQGILFLGHSEGGCLPNHEFVSAGNPRAFVYRKPSAKVGTSPPIGVPTTLPSPPRISPGAPPSKAIEHPLTQARAQADSNALSEAEELCQSHLHHHPFDADGYALLGEIFQARSKEAEAIKLFQKALYLNPRHYESLVHLMLLKQKQGDLLGAGILQQRIDRLMKH